MGQIALIRLLVIVHQSYVQGLVPNDLETDQGTTSGL